LSTSKVNNKRENKMEIENDPNIVYKCDLDESLDYATFGDLLVKCLKTGGDKIALVNNY
jgi:hypothetical protein